MKYAALFEYLKDSISFDDDLVELEGGTRVHSLGFESRHTDLLPAEYSPGGAESDVLDVADALVEENRSFRYHVFTPPGGAKSREMLLLFHGLNEKHWYKYLPWAAKMLELTGKSVVLFPIAFHMNRAPVSWSDARLMHGLSQRRKNQFPDVLHSSLLNAAISIRLQRNPQRFIWSGLQTYHDVEDFVASCKRGEHPLFEKDPSIDILAYSIGAFLSEVLLLSNPQELFSDSRLFMFCGGPVFNRISAVSKFILDSEANVRLYSYVVEHLESHIRSDPKLRAYLEDNSEYGIAFRSMLNYKTMPDYREERFRQMAGRITAMALAKDEVIPPYEVENTLRGRKRDIPVRVETIDFPYPYKHEDPFPILKASSDEVARQFDGVFEKIGRFLS